MLEQCLSTQPSDGQLAESWRGISLLAMSTLLYESGNYVEAIEKLQKVENFKNSILGVRVAAMEALAGLYLQLGQWSQINAYNFVKSTNLKIIRHTGLSILVLMQ